MEENDIINLTNNNNILSDIINKFEDIIETIDNSNISDNTCNSSTTNSKYNKSK